jgi:hypothetical protein
MSDFLGKILLSILAILLPPAAAILLVYFIQIKIIPKEK